MEQDSSERLNQITLADMEFIPNTAYVYFEFFGTSTVGEMNSRLLEMFMFH